MAFPRLSALTLLASLMLFLFWTTSSARSHDLTSSDLSPPYRLKRDLDFETREKVKETFEVVKETLSAFKDLSEATDVLKKLAKFASLAPGCAGVLFSVVNMALAFIPQDDPVLNAVKEGFSEVNRKLDSISIQISNLAVDVEWFNYVSVYSQDELRILNGWRKLEEFRVNSELAQSQEDKLRQAEIFTNYYEYTGTEASVANLYHYLTVSTRSLSANLIKLLTKKFKCDIKEIGEYNLYLSSLLLKGIVLNEVYWKLSGLNPSDKHSEMFHNVYIAQFSAMEFCLKNYEEYMLNDVKEIIKKISLDDKRAVADQVKKDLDKKYNWYNWVVLVYDPNQDANHILYDVKKVPEEKITLGLGHTNKRLEINDGIRRLISSLATECFHDQPCEFNDIKSTLQRCRRLLPDSGLESPTLYLKDNVKVIQVTTDTGFVEIPDNAKFVVDCKWGWSTGRMSLHYSWSKSVCQPGTCANSGKCRRLLDSNESLCECPVGYYGDKCEHRMDTSFVQKIYARYPVPTVTSLNGRLKMMESKLEQMANTINDRCRG